MILPKPLRSFCMVPGYAKNPVNKGSIAWLAVQALAGCALFRGCLDVSRRPAKAAAGKGRACLILEQTAGVFHRILEKITTVLMMGRCPVISRLYFILLCLLQLGGWPLQGKIAGIEKLRPRHKLQPLTYTGCLIRKIWRPRLWKTTITHL